MGSFHVTLDNVAYSRKPSGGEIAAITERAKRAGGVLMDYDSFTRHVYNGGTWVPGTFTTGKVNDEGKVIWGDFISLQVFALDFDNDTKVLDADGKPVKGKKRPLLPHEPGYLNPTQALARCRKLGALPFLMYFSFSARPGWPRYRLVFDIGEPCCNEGEAGGYIATMLKEFPEADQGCSNANRLFFGSPRAVHTFREVWT